MSVTMNNEGPGFVALPPVPEGAVMVTLKIRRFNPEDPGKAGWVSFEVPCLPTDRLLNLLTYVKGYLDGTLTFRRSCAHGVCGSDAMVINGVNRLACKVLMRDMLNKDGKNTTVTIAPLKGLPVEKDLVVDMEPFFSAYGAATPDAVDAAPECPSAPRRLRRGCRK
ncbi:possible succinate dehydrogenase Fe-S protein (plasmid) [Rhodococcus jostii RHA1]|uniref:Possible succinate dehydrogenase Fe-S protein n=2 Tax=Rhodococcus TaxID=1827 RepID=Q0RZH4_RHOJR|nr:possible succinate dehydrogenase Fe-S protein [Rhodococcus jostii RHA1]EID74453.1 succinate dehydrogenase Fe-S protein [Rhodococcus opacus RKJ300 = JCM 13270]QQZ18550.1 ferredoxin [Rhodococcus sp. 21391]